MNRPLEYRAGDKRKRIVISQPMYFPWIGLFEQIRLADVYVHYDDVQFSKGSFVNRVQYKTAAGSKWLTVPLRGLKLGQPIAEVMIDYSQDWQRRHLESLRQAYACAPYSGEMLQIAQDVLRRDCRTISELAAASIETVCEYYSLGSQDKFCHSSAVPIAGKSSQRVFEMVRHFDGDIYVTGHGARNYLDHNLFEQNHIRVEYMNYQKRPYRQEHGEFTPFVSILDLIANMGPGGRDLVCSGTVDWKEFAA